MAGTILTSTNKLNITYNGDGVKQDPGLIFGQIGKTAEFVLDNGTEKRTKVEGGYIRNRSGRIGIGTTALGDKQKVYSKQETLEIDIKELEEKLNNFEADEKEMKAKLKSEDFLKEKLYEIKLKEMGYSFSNGDYYEQTTDRICNGDDEYYVDDEKYPFTYVWNELKDLFNKGI